MKTLNTEKIKVLIDEKKIEERVTQLSEAINRDFGDEPLIVIGILKGSFMFLSDLVKKLKMPTEIHFMKASSYGSGTKSCGTVAIKLDVDRDISGKNVLIVEDIIDSGFTMCEVRKILENRGTKNLKLCSGLSKPSRREVDVDIEYLGFEIPDEFVVGYGLDFDEKYRNLPYIGYIEMA